MNIRPEAPKHLEPIMDEHKIHIEEPNTTLEIEACYEVMRQLRPHLSKDGFVEQVLRQRAVGYHLATLTSDGQVVVVAGFRISECLSWGRFLYVDDLVTDEGVRHSGFGRLMFQWLLEFARKNNCKVLHLDSGVQRYDAHRFYLRNGMKISSHHFEIAL